MHKTVNKIIALLCYFPYVPVLIFYSYVLRAILQIGGIPSYENPDPKALGFEIHRSLVYPAFDAAIYGSLVLMCLVVILLIAGRLSISRKFAYIYGIGLALALYCLVLDPLMKWFAD